LIDTEAFPAMSQPFLSSVSRNEWNRSTTNSERMEGRTDKKHLNNAN